MDWGHIPQPITNLAASQEPCYLLKLPNELKLGIVKQLHERRDLYNLSLACRSLEDIILSRLYKSIEIDIPISSPLGWSHDALPSFRTHVLENTRELTIRNGMLNMENPGYHQRQRSDANSIEGYISGILDDIPQNQLKAFSIIHGLTSRHGRELQHFHCCELKLPSDSQFSVPSHLRSLECRSVLSGEAITRLIETNKGTLRSLSIGQDQFLLEQYRQRRIGFLSKIPQPTQSFHDSLDLSAIQNLRSMSLSGIDLAPLIPQVIDSVLVLIQLDNLTLESCPNTAGFLDIISFTFSQIQSSVEHGDVEISLKKFSFRSEFFPTSLKDSLVRLLSSFSGLKSLSILIENSTFAARLSTFLRNHGKTLETLVIESRIQPREYLEVDTSRPVGISTRATPTDRLWSDNLSDICTLCPSLVELGMALPWDNEAVKSHIGKLGELKHLETLHIRNFPSSPQSGELGMERIKQYVIKFLARAYHSSSSTTSDTTPSPPALEILAIGPTLYSSRWRLGAPAPSDIRSILQPHIRPFQVPPSSHCSSAAQEPRLNNLEQVKKPDALPEHLRTHYFTVDWTKPSVTVNSVSERYIEEVRGQRGLGGVFEPVWLR